MLCSGARSGEMHRSCGDASKSGSLRYMSGVAERGGLSLAAMWGTSLMPPDVEERQQMQASMANVRVPCGCAGEMRCPADPSALSAQIVREVKTWVPIGEYAGPGRGLWVRISASVYNEVGDFELFGRALLKALGHSGGRGEVGGEVGVVV
mmetsp:Transcript_13340/g.47086  ORF Transcript_13340/g.47086 Transcript_13340/m.47086 type:complete len:151 (-) Transcript_13340:169-621(-)